MATEGHGAPGPSRSGFGIQRTAEAPEAPQTPLYPPCTQGSGGTRSKKNQEPSPLEGHLCAIFHPNPSSSLDFYSEQTP